AGGQIEAADAPVGDIGDQQAPLSVEAAIVGLAHGSVGCLAAVAGEVLLAIARHGSDDAGLAVNLADHGVEAIDDVEVSVLVHGAGVGLVDGGVGRLVAVAGVAFLARAGDGGDDAGLEIDLANAVVHRLGDVEMAAVIDIAMERLAEGCLAGRAAVAGVAALAG